MAVKRVMVGEIGRPHGVRGLVRLRAFTEDPTAIAAYSPLTDASGTRRFAITLKGGVAGVASTGRGRSRDQTTTASGYPT